MKKDLATLLEDIAIKSDTKAFQTLFDVYFDCLFKFAMVFVKNRELAQEVVSDVFIKVWENRSALTKIDNIKSYLFIATKNQALTYLKRKLAHTGTVSLEGSANLDFFIENFTPEYAILLEELYDNLNKVVNALPHRQKMAFQLVREEKMSFKEAGDIMGISISAVEKLVQKANKQIIEQLRAYLEQQEDDKNSPKVIKLAYSLFFLIFFI